MNKAKYSLIFFLVTFAYFLSGSSVGQESSGKDVAQKLERFLQLAEELRGKLGVPGVGIAIVYENQVLYQGGLGFRDVENRIPVSKDTLFSIGSNTKAFTGLVATKLVTRGVIEWDVPLIQYVPELQLKEEYVTQHVTLADALAHRSGLSRNRDIWQNHNGSRAELLEKLKDVEFESSFRSDFNYNNLMYMVAGTALERVTQTPWEELVKREVLEPLGMKNSFTMQAEFMNSEHRAIGYHNDGIRPAKPVDLTCIAPAGAIFSTPSDISRWIKMLVNQGSHNNQTYLSQEECDYMLRPHSRLSIRNGDELWYYYTGLGGFSKNGMRTLGADGAIDGQNSRCVLKLDEGFGIFVMTNRVSDYKSLLTQYAEQIFLRDELSRDWEKELSLASVASFDKFLTRLIDDGIASAQKEYDQRRIKPSEAHMNQLGYQLLSENEIKEAVFTLKLNTQSYPESANAHDSLAEAYSNADEIDLAVAHYKKSISLDPENENAKKMLEKMIRQRKKR